MWEAYVQPTYIGFLMQITSRPNFVACGHKMPRILTGNTFPLVQTKFNILRCDDRAIQYSKHSTCWFVYDADEWSWSVEKMTTAPVADVGSAWWASATRWRRPYRWSREAWWIPRRRICNEERSRSRRSRERQEPPGQQSWGGTHGDGRTRAR